MGARASRRRHEGRAIRKFRRKWGDVTPAFARVVKAMLPLGRAAERAAKSMVMVTEVWTMPSGTIAFAQQPDGTTLIGIDPGVGHPSQSGVEAVRSQQEAAQSVDDMAVRMRLELMPWQRELAIAALTGTPLTLVGGKQSGRATVKRIVDEIRGPESGEPIIDEIHRMPLG
uniref:Uncharacterized protein n=1 Tax=Microbacterium phage Judebell TaxID=3230835 RepID=A0AAU8EFC6_9CAUD